MITKYFAQVAVRFNPASAGSKSARMFLASLPPKSRTEIKVTQKVLTSADDTEEIKVTFKDGKTISVDPSSIGTSYDMQQTFDQYSRKLKIKDDMSDN